MGNRLIWILLLCAFQEISYGYDCKTETRCKIGNMYKMKAADCSKKELKIFPKCVPSDVQVLELTFNRIRIVNKSDLDRLGYLTILYLRDNLISNLDDEIFDDLDSLTILDLSLNAITKIPTSLFKLPSLNKLYLSENFNINIIDAVEEAKLISSPLTFLDISFTTTEDNVQDFPYFGFLPMLLTLNITGNRYVSLAPKHFAGMCNLKTLANSDVTTDFVEGCDCWIINNWLNERKVQFTPFQCSKEENDCLGAEVDLEHKEVYKQCIEKSNQIKMLNRLWKIGISVGVVLIVLIILGFLYIFLLKRRNRRDAVSKQGKENTPTEADGMLLLNNQTTLPS